MAPADMWCPNCQQMVRPDRQQSGGNLAVGCLGLIAFSCLLWGLAGLVGFVAPNGFDPRTRIVVGVVAAALAVAASRAAKPDRLSCPICKSEALEARG